MNTYQAGKNGDRELRYAGTREWVFPLLPTRAYRDRISLLSGLELRRRPDCEPTLRSLVTDDWTPETIHHVGWCESCRTAGFALGAGAFAGGRPAASPARRRATWVAVAAGVAIAAPLVGGQIVGNPFDASQAVARGGVSHVVHHAAPGSTATAGSSGSSGAPGSPASTTPVVVPVPRARPAIAKPAVARRGSHRAHVVDIARGRRALPLTT